MAGVCSKHGPFEGDECSKCKPFSEKIKEIFKRKRKEEKPVEEKVKKEFSCKNCGAPIKGYPCPTCGWKPKKPGRVSIGLKPKSGTERAIALFTSFGIVMISMFWVFEPAFSLFTYIINEIIAGYGFIIYLIIIPVTFLIAWKISNLGLGGALIFGIALIIPIIIISFFVSGIPLVYGTTIEKEENPHVQYTICVGKNSLPWSFDVAGISACYEIFEAFKEEKPEAQKIGSYSILDVKFGSEETEFRLPPLYWEKNKKIIYRYIFPVTVKNPSQEKKVDSLYFTKETGFYNLTDLLFKELVFDQCSESRPCDIQPEDEIVVTMDSQEDLNYTTRSLTIKLFTAQKMKGEGSNDFVFIKSYGDRKIAPRPKPETTEGPVDITVYFAPSNYIFGTTFVDTIRLFIHIENKGRGTAKFKEVSITKFDEEGFLTDPQNCSSPWGDISLTNGKLQLPTEKSLSTFPFVFRCEYKVNKKTMMNPYKTIHFNVRIDYTYEQTFRKELRVTEIE